MASSRKQLLEEKKKEVKQHMVSSSSHPRRRAGFYRWKKPSHVQKISFTLDKDRRPIRVGGENTGDYYLGRIRFNDGKMHRVVIKRFKNNLTINRTAVAHFHQAIKKLVKAGVRVPKMGLIRIATLEHPDGEYVVVAPFFGSRTKGSAFEKNHVSRDSPFDIRKQAMEQLTRIANTGLLSPLDAVNVHTNHARGVRVIDLDFTIEHILFHQDAPRAILNSKVSATEIAMSVRELSTSTAEKEALLRIALQHAVPAIRNEIQKIEV